MWIHAEEKRKTDRKNRKRTEAEAFRKSRGCRKPDPAVSFRLLRPGTGSQGLCVCTDVFRGRSGKTAGRAAENGQPGSGLQSYQGGAFNGTCGTGVGTAGSGVGESDLKTGIFLESSDFYREEISALE